MKLLSYSLLTCIATYTSHAELVAHWPLDTDATDATGNGFNGTIVGGTVTFGETGANANTGSAAVFPDNGHIDIPFDTALNPVSFTVSLWANAASTAGFASPVTSRDDVANPGGSVHGFILYNDSAGNWNFWSGTGGGAGAWDVNPGPVVELDTWVHLALTFDATTDTKTLWVNGEIADAETAPGLYSPNGTIEMENFHIGSGSDTGEDFYFDGLIDDVAIWNVALDQAVIRNVMTNGVASGFPDPALGAPGAFPLVFEGGVQVFDLTIANDGQTQNLIVSSATFEADSNFTVTSLPDPIAPGGSGILKVTFDPAGTNGVFEADLELTSNDSLVPVRTVTLRGAIHDPMIVSEGMLDLGTETTGSMIISNDGATRPLNISGLNITGTDAAKFTVTLADQISAAGGSATLDVTFDPQGKQGTFTATLEITSDDPLVPVRLVNLIAKVPVTDSLVAWWPLDVDGTDASGNGFDGVVEGAPVASPGANGATGGSLDFDGSSTRIDVPFDTALNPVDFTITLWANADTTDGYASPITARDDVDGGASTHGFILYNDIGGVWNFWTGDGNAGWDALPGDPVTAEAWTHLAMTFDSITGTKSLWVNGILSATETAPDQYSPNGTVEMEALHIGAGQDDGLNFFFDGRIDDIGLFRSALSSEDINAIMTNGVAGFTGAARILEITDIDLVAIPGQVRLTFNSTNGASYSIERSTDLAEDSWQELNDNVASEGEVTTYADTTVPVGATKLFYRVVKP